MAKCLHMLCLVSLMLCIPNCGFAKIISDDTGSITFETSNKWYLTSLGEDEFTYELISIGLDEDSFIKITQSKVHMKYKNFKQASDTEKSKLRDYMIRYYLNLFRSKGYRFTVNKAEFFNDSILIGATLRKNNFTGKMLVASFIKDYIAYNITAVCSEMTAVETMKTLRTLKIDGRDFGVWVGQ